MTSDGPAAGRHGYDHTVVSTTLVLGCLTSASRSHGSLRVVGQPERTVTWVVEEPILLAAIEELQGALPDPEGTETQPTR